MTDEMEQLADYVMSSLINGEPSGDPVVGLHEACQAVIDSYTARQTVAGAWRFHKSMAWLKTALAYSRQARGE